MKNEVNPNRFIGKTFARRKTFPGAVDDYVVMIDGLMAGRIMETRLSFGVVKWLWTVTGPYLPPELQMGNGQEETLEQAQQAFKAKFWQRQRWAVEQKAGAHWHGAEA